MRENIKFNAKLMRDRSCLVTNDETLVIEVPYLINQVWEEHLAKLRKQEQDK